MAPEKCRIKHLRFKDLEAGPTVKMLQESKEKRILTVASAGNTARAFANTCHLANLPLLLVVPRDALAKLWVPLESNTERIFLLAIDGDYSEAIAASNELCSLNDFVAEGGAKNIARRDGMGTVVLDAAFAMKRLRTTISKQLAAVLVALPPGKPQ